MRKWEAAILSVAIIWAVVIFAAATILKDTSYPPSDGRHSWRRSGWMPHRSRRSKTQSRID